MSKHTPGSRRGFTLIELLLAMGIIAVLAAILLPTLAAVSRQARITNTQGLISRLGLAAEVYLRDQTTYPPDYVGVGTYLRGFGPNDPWTWQPKDLTSTPTGAQPPEALYYYLGNPFLAANHPYISLRKGAEWMDCNTNGLPEIVDSWSRPILYNRPAFPSGFDYPNNPSLGLHKVGFYDLFSLGPDGLVGTNTTPPLGHQDPKPPYTCDANTSPWDTGSLAKFCYWTIVENTAGQGDDITNWKRQ